MIPRPAPSEYAPAFEKYISLVEGDPLVFLERQTAAIKEQLGNIHEAQSMHRYAPGKWSIKELLGHVIDAERIFCYRLLCLARSETAPLPGFEEDDYVRAASFDQRSFADLSEEFMAVRLASMPLIHSLQPETASKSGIVNGRTITAAGQAYVLAGHAEHHLRILRERYLAPSR